MPRDRIADRPLPILRPRRPLTALLIVVAILLSGCTGGDSGAEGEPTSGSATGDVSPGEGGSAELPTDAGTWRVTVPADAVDAEGTVTVMELPPWGGEPAGPGIDVVGGVSVTLSQGQPRTPVTLSLTLDAPLPADMAAAFVHRPQDDETGDVLPVTASEDRRQLTAELSHLSDFFGFIARVVDSVAGKADGIARVVGSILGERADPPNCEDRPPWLDDAIFVDDSSGARNTPMLTCVGVDPNDPDRIAVKIANNRSTGLIVTAPVEPAWVWMDGAGDGVRDHLIAASSWLVEQLALGGTDRSYVLAPGQQIHLGFTQQALRDVSGPIVVQGAVGHTAALFGMIHQLFEGSVADSAALTMLELAVLARCGIDAVADPLGETSWNALLTSTAATLVCVAENAREVVEVMIDLLPEAIWERWNGGIIDAGKIARRAGIITAIASATWNAAEFIAAMNQDPSAYRVTLFLTPVQRPDVVLQMGGTVGDLGLFPAADQAEEYLTERLGPPTTERSGSFCDQGGGPGRVLEWDNFTVYLLDDLSQWETGVPGMELRGPGLVGWAVSGFAPRRPNLRTAEGIAWGSTVAQVRAAYPGEEPEFRGIEWAFDIFRGDLSNLWISVSGEAPTDRVVAMTAGFACPE